MVTKLENSYYILESLRWAEDVGDVVEKRYVGNAVLLGIIDCDGPNGCRQLLYISSTHYGPCALVDVVFEESGPNIRCMNTGVKCDDATADDIVLVMQVVWRDLAEKILEFRSLQSSAC